MTEKRIVAYLDPLSVEAGEELKVMVSCEAAGSFELTIATAADRVNRWYLSNDEWYPELRFEWQRKAATQHRG